MSTTIPMRSKVLGGAAALAAILAIGWLDYVTGPDLGFSLFYLLPVVSAGMWFGRTLAIVTAVVASVAWLAADLSLLGSSGHAISVWNGFTRLIIFSFVGVLTALLRRDRRRLQELLRTSEAAARTDAVTGLPNLRALLEIVGRDLARAERTPRSICVAYIDLDDFKSINDRFGHAAGNELLGRIGQTLRRSVRSGDVAARIGGDEFALLLWEADAGTGEAIAARIIERISAMRADYPGTRLGASAGVAYFEAPPEADALLQAADEAMYQAKSSGKGRVVVRSAG